ALADAADTLAVMGYSKAESAEALRGINADQPLENIIKDALRKLNRLG
ncbi:MAG: Holliday junction branch migration protein RuvA, partial [Clostridia bacterium]|nr:Holliday junction branch migration protein RuvA [Clostridia bacterium]